MIRHLLHLRVSCAAAAAAVVASKQDWGEGGRGLGREGRTCAHSGRLEPRVRTQVRTLDDEAGVSEWGMIRRWSWRRGDGVL
jgi:hypothetical protein